VEEWIKLIQEAKAVGITLEEIREYIENNTRESDQDE
jgi:DNA-binding transcriptional MerR regulator